MALRIGVIAIGGMGRRFGNANVQKCLVEFDGKPIVEYTIEAFVQAGIRVIYFLTGFHRDQVDAYLARRSDLLPCTYASVFGGTQGQIAAVLRLRNFLDEEFLYAPADCIFTRHTVIDFAANASGRRGTIAAVSVSPLISSAPDHPRIEILPGTTLARRCHSPNRGHPLDPIVTGIYYFRPEAFDVLSRTRVDSPFLCGFVNTANDAGKKVAVVATDDPWFSLHTSDDLRKWPLSQMRGAS